MDPAILTAMSGVLGSLVGGSATVATAWITQRTTAHREVARAEVRKRETLYGDFIGECAKLLMDAFDHTLEKPTTLLPAYALLNRVRLCASPAVVAQAEHLLARITDEYFSMNRTVDDLRRLAHSDEADPLKDFGEVCRAELKSMHAKV
jgi:hypothetical protein